METNLTVIQEDLRAKSKSTLVLGILSQVIPTVLFVLFYIAAMVGQFAAVRHRATEFEQLMPMLLLLMVQEHHHPEGSLQGGCLPPHR